MNQLPTPDEIRQRADQTRRAAAADAAAARASIEAAEEVDRAIAKQERQDNAKWHDQHTEYQPMDPEDEKPIHPIAAVNL